MAQAVNVFGDHRVGLMEAVVRASCTDASLTLFSLQPELWKSPGQESAGSALANGRKITSATYNDHFLHSEIHRRIWHLAT